MRIKNKIELEKSPSSLISSPIAAPNMDNIYNVRSSDLINIKETYEEYLSSLRCLPGLNTASIKDLISFEGSQADYTDLEASVSLEQISHADDVCTNTFNKQRQARDKVKSVLEIYNLLTDPKKHPKLQFSSVEELHYRLVETPRSEEAPDLQAWSDVVITIRVYNPYKIPPGGRKVPQFNEEFQVLGSQLLTELRDIISCKCNKHHFYDVSEEPEQALPEKTTDPGFFFITDTFYNDLRNPLNANYSAAITKWTEKCRDIGKQRFATKTMESTRFLDLSVKLGFPQVYQHHGNCEHIFVFSCIEILAPANTLARSSYPVLKSISKLNAVMCSMCGRTEFVFVVLNSDRQPYEYTMFCRKCFVRYNYVDGKKVGSFQAFRINDYKADEELDDEEEGEVDVMDEDEGEEVLGV